MLTCLPGSAGDRAEGESVRRTVVSGKSLSETNPPTLCVCEQTARRNAVVTAP